MNGASRFSRMAAVGAACLAVGATCVTPTQAAERQVLYEVFTATWCGYCPDIASALRTLMGNYPGEIIPIQCHVSDSYTTAWGNQRANYYSVGGIPHTVCDGIFQRIGGGSAYSQLNSWRSNRMATPTDVEITLDVIPQGGQTYNIVAEIGVEAGGVGKDMVVHMANCLREYPNSAERLNCVRMGWNKGTHTFVPGETTTFEQTVTFDSASWDNQGDINIVVFVQEPGTGLGTEVYNARYSDYPFIDTCIHNYVEVPITPEAIADDPSLEGAKTFDLQVETIYGDDWTSTDGTITVDGDFYQHQFDGDVPQPPLWPAFPGLAFDSYFSAPEFTTPGFASGPDVTNNSMSAIWFDVPVHPDGLYTIGRYTVTSGTTLSMSGTTTAANTGGSLLPFAFEIDLGVSDCPGDLNGDGQRDQSDLGVLLAAYGVDAGGDIDGDGDTDQADLGALLAVYNVPCP